MALEAGIMHAPHLRVFFEEAGQSQSVLVLPLDAEAKRFQTAQQQEGTVRIEGRADEFAKMIDHVNQVLPPANNSSEHVSMPAQKFGRAVDH